MIRTALRLTAVAVPVTALVLAAGGTASADDDDNDFLKSRIIITKTYQHGNGSGHHGAYAYEGWTTSVLIETGMGEDLEYDGD
ncbi:hypothetical protein [Streptomyces sclerotialus]|uniref:hypothetical protein n=1 Tax=Streptomyces sclerotialus TaxID=1957 RepID=UPI0004C6A0AC